MKFNRSLCFNVFIAFVFITVNFISVTVQYSIASEEGVSFGIQNLKPTRSDKEVNCKQNDGKILIDFEGLSNHANIKDSYKSCGVIFSDDALALIDSDAGGDGNIANEPSPNTCLFFLNGNAATLNFSDGIVNGFSFYYSAIGHSGYIKVYSQENRQGELLAELILPIVPSLGQGDPNGQYDNWKNTGVEFKGIAKSIDFGGTANYIVFDNITLNSAVAAGAKVSYFEFSNISDQVLDTFFEIKITAKDQYGNKVNNFNSKVELFSNPYLSLKIENESGIIFTDGEWVGKIKILQGASGLVLKATYQDIFGESNAFSMVSSQGISNYLGGVVTKNNVPIPNVPVTLFKVGSDTKNTTSDKNGFYEFKDVEPSSYILSASTTINSMEYKYSADIQIYNFKAMQKNINLRSGKRRLLVVPGIMGSTIEEQPEGKDKQSWWPILDKVTGAYDYKSELYILDPNEWGTRPVKYQEFKNIFKDDYEVIEVPYDWRMSIDQIASQFLKKIIDEQKELSGYSTVDVVAHSMGGLVTRSYIQSDSYDNDIKKFVMLGTPNQGSSDVYIILEGGDPKRMDDIKGNSSYNFYYQSTLEQWENTYKKKEDFKAGIGVKNFLMENMISTNQLIPTYKFLDKKDNNDNPHELKVLQNVFLKELNDNIQNQNKMQSNEECNGECVQTALFLANSKSTVNNINILDATNESDKLWPDGEVYDPWGSESETKTENNGDGTVIAEKASEPFDYDKNIAQAKDYNAEHAGLFWGARADAYKFLTGKTYTQKTVKTDAPAIPDHKLAIYLYGQVQPFLTNPLNQVEGVDFNTFALVNNIPDATTQLHSNSSSIKIDEPIKGEYQLKIKGPVQEDFNLSIGFYDNISEKLYEITKKMQYKQEVLSVSFKLDPEKSEPLYFIEQIATPTDLISANSNGLVKLNWNKSQQANSYNIYVATETQEFKLVGSTNETSYETSDIWSNNKKYYCVTANNGTNESSFSNIVHNQDALDASFTGDILSGHLPLTVHFTDQSKGEITSWNWDFNLDGIIDSTEQNPIYTYNNEGIYSVKLTISGADREDQLTVHDYIVVKESIPNTYRVLTDNSEPLTISYGEHVKVFGSAGGNTINVRSGGKVECVNFVGPNVVNVEDQSSGFTVYRSGATVYLKNITTGTLIKIPATKTPQNMIFNNTTLTLLIENNRVMLGNQVINLNSSPIL